jgi:hypothetical protein
MVAPYRIFHVAPYPITSRRFLFLNPQFCCHSSTPPYPLTPPIQHATQIIRPNYCHVTTDNCLTPCCNLDVTVMFLAGLIRLRETTVERAQGWRPTEYPRIQQAAQITRPNYCHVTTDNCLTPCCNLEVTVYFLAGAHPIT